MATLTQRPDVEQLLPDIFDERSRTEPQGIFAKVPISMTNYSDGFRAVTFEEIATAINRVAWLLDAQFGKGENFPTITYIGPSDLRYSIVVIAAIKAGYKTFLPSPRNSQSAFLSLLSRLDCKRLVVTTPEAPCIPLIQEGYEVEKLNIPSLQELLGSQGLPEYPFDRTWEEAKNDPIFVLHTSGSTGIPKPLIYTHSFVAGIANNTSISPPKGFRSLDINFRTGNFFMTLPSFHVAGIGFSLIVPAFHGGTPVYPLPTAPPTIQGIIDAINNTDLDWAFLPPVFIDELGKDPVLLETVASRLKYVYYTGGSVPKVSGDAVTKKLGLYQVLGSSECATFPLIQAESDGACEDWNCVQIHPEIKAEFQHRFDDLYELVVVKREDPQHYQPVFSHFPDLSEYETRDLFSAHPTKPGLWTHQSRIDDVIVFLNGEKTNPISFEQEVGRHPEVRAALVGGQQRFEAFLLVELNDTTAQSDEERKQIIDRIWPVVDQANETCPAYARVSRSRILLADPTMPFPRAGKGTVQRQAAMKLYSNAIDELYAEPEIEISTTSLKNIDFEDRGKIEKTVTQLVKSVTKWRDFQADDEFFGMGMDSLQVLRLSRELRSKFGLSTLTLKDIYTNPSLRLLTEAVIAQALKSEPGSLDLIKERSQAISNTIQRYQNEIDSISSKVADGTCNGIHGDAGQAKSSRVVILTGSTGALGSYILHSLLLQDNVGHVYCLNRAVDSEAVQKQRNLQHALATDISSHRVTFTTVDLSAPDLGIEKSLLDTISSTVTEIIHNAWPVDFNKTLQSFQTTLDGVRNLISLAAVAKLSPSVLFVSSISSVINFRSESQDLALVPEEVIRDAACAARMGYGESKYVAEQVLDYAARKLGVNSGTVRVGQISGTAVHPRGWNRNEWFPSLVLSSKHIGALPESLGTKIEHYPAGVMGKIDWVPIDQLADVVVDLSSDLRISGPRNELRVFHAVNPQVVSWDDLLPVVQQILKESDEDIRIIPYSDWVNLLHSSSKYSISDKGASADEYHVFKNPGIKLLDFYESLLGSEETTSLARLDIARTSKISPSLRNLEPVKSDWMKGWIGGWLSAKPSI